MENKKEDYINSLNKYFKEDKNNYRRPTQFGWGVRQNNIVDLESIYHKKILPKLEKEMKDFFEKDIISKNIIYYFTNSVENMFNKKMEELEKIKNDIKKEIQNPLTKEFINNIKEKISEEIDNKMHFTDNIIKLDKQNFLPNIYCIFEETKLNNRPENHVKNKLSEYGYCTKFTEFLSSPLAKPYELKGKIKIKGAPDLILFPDKNSKTTNAKFILIEVKYNSDGIKVDQLKWANKYSDIPIIYYFITKK